MGRRSTVWRTNAMPAKAIVSTALLLFGSKGIRAQSVPDKDVPKFMGREVTIAKPELDADGFFPKGPAEVCLEGPPQRQCYSAPGDFGRDPAVALVQVAKGLPALFFSAASGGVSGFGIHFAILRPGTGKDLRDLFSSAVSVSNQSQHEFWDDSTISPAKIFVTADFVWGPDESHYSPHRYIISAYIFKHSPMSDDLQYYLEDRYMTAHSYELGANADILASEKQEIIARLGRLKP
jgi:hypothetical protein